VNGTGEFDFEFEFVFTLCIFEYVLPLEVEGRVGYGFRPVDPEF
jgi:hypothetical protein